MGCEGGFLSKKGAVGLTARKEPKLLREKRIRGGAAISLLISLSFLFIFKPLISKDRISLLEPRRFFILKRRGAESQFCIA
jgi:hypothetical protein